MRKWILLIAVLLAFGIAPVFAQPSDTDAPLLQLLARIPDTPSAHAYFSYIDYQALLASRPGIPKITSWDQLSALLSTKTDQNRLIVATLQGIKSGPAFYPTNLMQLGGMAQLVGFDPFEIERAIAYGTPPNDVTLLQGAFDTEAVASAYEKRGYTALSTAPQGIQVLCPADGCDNGKVQHLDSINPANPFGGQLGRSQPVALADKLVASSTDITELNLAVNTIAGTNPSLADQPDYRAAAEAITANGTLIQNYFINPAEVNSVSGVLPAVRMTAAQIKALTAQLQADFVPVPAYNLVALADSVADNEQQARVALVYTNQADAEAAAALFPKHLQDYTSLVTRQPMSDLFDTLGVTSVEASVFPASTNRFVMVLTLHAPLASSTIPADGSTIQQSSLVYSLLVRAYLSRDLGWLASQF